MPSPVSSADLVVRVRDLLADQPYTTTSTTTGTGTTITIPDTTNWADGDIGEFQAGTVGYEQFLVVGDPPSSTTLTVVRGYGGTTAEAHSSGVSVVQNPTFFGRQVQQAISDGVRSLWPFVYRVEDIDVTPVIGQGWYDVSGALDDTLGIISVTQMDGTAPNLVIQKYKAKDLIFEPEANTDVVASGQALYIPFFYHQTNTIKVKVMESVTGDADIEDNSLFPVADCVIYLAAGRLVGGGEIQRVSSGTDLETTGTVSTGSRSSAGANFSGIGKRKLEELAITYRRHYKPMRLGDR